MHKINKNKTNKNKNKQKQNCGGKKAREAMRAGRPGEFVGKIAQNVAQPIVLSYKCQNIWATFEFFKKNLATPRKKITQKAKIRPMWSPCVQGS
jgi:hypothetical protein